MTRAVSVCIPVYNGERYIGEAIRSVLAQTFTEFELLVIDNASEDRTMEVLAEFEDPRLRCVRNDRNIGAAANFNRALDMASAPYVKILCADDTLHPDCLKRQVAILDCEPSVAMVTTRRRIIDAEGRPRLIRGLRRSGRLSPPGLFKTIVRSGTNPIGEPSAVLIRRSCAEAAGRFNPERSYAIDLEYWMRVLLHGDLWVIPEPLATFRVSGASWSLALLGAQASSYRGLIADLRRSGEYGLSRFDVFIGGASATLNSAARRLYYAVNVRSAR